MRHEPGVFQKAKAAFDFLLARRVVLQHVFVVELRLIQLIGGENKAAFLLNFAAPRFKYGGDARFNTITDRIGCPAFAGTTFAFETNHFDDARIVQGDDFQRLLQV